MIEEVKGLVIRNYKINRTTKAFQGYQPYYHYEILINRTFTDLHLRLCM